jgi:tetratricopeptide (TPR) repeat protein
MVLVDEHVLAGLTGPRPIYSPIGFWRRSADEDAILLQKGESMLSLGLDSGMLVADRFVIEDLTGHSTRSAGFRARDRQTGRLVALWVIEIGQVTAPEVTAWIEDARRLAAVQHGAVAACLGYGQTEQGTPYLATEWPEGEDLKQRLERRPLTLAESLKLAAVLGEGLAELHRHGVVHGNIEPRNVVLRNGEVGGAVLMGFGLMRGSFGWKTVTSGEEIVEALQYVSPERARGESELGPESDVFALGCVWFECLTGTAPFGGAHAVAVLSQILHGEPPRLGKVRPELPAVLEPLLEKMLAREPGQRFRDGGAVLAALGALTVPAGCEGLMPPEAAPGLLGTEKQLVGLVLARPRIPDEAAAARETEGLEQEIEALLGPCQGGLERLGDGALLVRVWQLRATATDQAVQTVQTALGLRERLEGWSLVVTMGRIVLPGGRLEVEELERAAALLQGRDPHAPRAQETLWLDELTARLIDTRYHVRRVEGGWTVEGRRSGIEEARTLLGQPTPCVGREQELQILSAALHACTEDATASVLLVLASSGTGKSRLRQEFLLRLAERSAPLEVLFGAGDPRRAAVPYGLLGQAVRELCALSPAAGDDLAEEQRRLAERVGRHVAAAERQAVVEFVGELCGVPFPDEESPRLRAARQDPHLMNAQITRAVGTWLRAECQAHTVLLVLEDLHWGDAATVRVLGDVLGELTEEPLFVLALARPEVSEVFPALWSSRRVQELRLGKLGRKASEQLAREVLGGRVPEETIERIVAQAQGHALFLEELIRAAAEGIVGELPDTVAAMLEARFARLEEGARRALRAASIFGETFSSGGVAALLGQEEAHESVKVWLEALVKDEIIARVHRRQGGVASSGAGSGGGDEHRRAAAAQPAVGAREIPGRPRSWGEEEFSFRHALVRDAAYRLLSEEDLRAGHRRAGAYLERMGEPNARAVAEHYERGGARVEAVKFFVEAAWQADRRGDQQGVLECVERGVACGAEGEALGVLRVLEGMVHYLRWNFTAAITGCQRALELLPPGSVGWYRALMLLIPALSTLGQRETVLEYARTCFETALPSGMEHVFVEAASWIVPAVVIQGLRQLSGGFMGWIEDISARLGPKEVRIQALRWSAALWSPMLLEGNSWRHLTVARAGIPCFETADDERYAAVLHGHRALALALLGEREQALEAFHTTLAILQRLNEPLILGVTLLFRALSLVEMGQPEDLVEAQALAEQIIAQSPAPNFWIGLAYAALAGALLGQRQLEAAEGAARQGAAVMKSMGPPGRPLTQALLGRILLAEGRVEEAEAAVAEGLAAREELGGACFLEVKLLLAAAEIAHAAGDAARGRRWLAEAVQLLERRAGELPDAAMRERFMGEIKDHARVRELDRLWSA